MSRTITFAPVRKTIRVKAPPARAFKVFTTGTWWPKGHSILASGARQKEVVIEPRAGGRWFERGEDGSECDWGKVLAWEPPGRLLLTWQLNGRFQYDPGLVTEVEVTFIPDGADATRVELEHRHLERAGDTAEAMRAAIDAPDGWAGLLERFAQEAAG
ncbi:MAG TPA: SRPBCC family protein [Stellaceae bacterium]